MAYIFFMALLGGGFMAWAVGANDVANAMGTSVGSKAISLKNAILIAATFEILGALVAGQQVTGTIQKKLIDVSYYNSDPKTLMLGMIAALYASALWLVMASSRGWPVSTTHSIVGAVIGFGFVTQGASNMPWNSVMTIALGWVLTPAFSALVSWFVFRFIQYMVFSQDDPLAYIVKAAPWWVVFLTFPFFRLLILGAAQILSNQGYGYSEQIVMSYVNFASVIATILFYLVTRFWLLARMKVIVSTQRSMLEGVERVFAILVVLTACVMAFSHGANDVANAIGPMAAVFNLLEYGTIPQNAPIPLWVMMWGATGVAFGVGMYGYRVMERVGSDITVLSPSRSFAAQFATGLVVLIASFFGFPVSTTQTLVGGVLGVGFARGLAAVDMRVVRGIFMSWMVTIPAGAIFALLFFEMFKVVL